MFVADCLLCRLPETVEAQEDSTEVEPQAGTVGPFAISALIPP